MTVRLLSMLVPHLFAATLQASEFHVTPAGTRSGDGSTNAPWSVEFALSHPPAIKPGDSIVLHAGTYRGGFTSRLKGTADAAIIVRAAPGTRVTIDARPRDEKDGGLFTVNGEHAFFRDLEFTCSDEKRRTDITGSHPQDIRRGSINIHGSQIRFVNCVVHDLAQGFGFWSSGEGGEIYGCLIFHNGWVAPDRGHGHAIYAQNKAGTKRLADNILFNQFSHGIHAYGSSRAFISGFDVEGNIAFNNGSLAGPGQRAPDILIGGGSPSERIRVAHNYTYSTDARGVTRLGYGADNKDVRVEGNYFVGGLHLRKWQEPVLSNNLIVARRPLLWMEMIEGKDVRDLRSDQNRFFQVDDQAGSFEVARKGQPGWTGTLDDWRKLTGADANSRLERARPAGTRVFVRPNQYEPGRAHVAIYNWDRRDEVELDLSAALKVGQTFRVVSAQNFYGDAVAAGTFDGKPVRLPMKGTWPVQPVGMPGYSMPVTGPEFGAFVVLPGNPQ